MSISCLSLTSVFHLIILKIKKIRIHLSVQEINSKLLTMYSVKFSSVTQSCPTLRPHEPQHAWPTCPSPTPGVHPNPCPLSQWCHPTISSSLSPSPPAPNPSWHQGLFQWVSSSHQVAKVLEFQLQHESFQSTLLQNGLVGSPCSPRDSQESSPTPQFRSINSSVHRLLYVPTLTSIHDYWKNHSFDYMDFFQQSPCFIIHCQGWSELFFQRASVF